MFGRASAANIAVICGQASGNLVVLDADSAEQYDRILSALSAKRVRTRIVQRAPNGSPHDGGGHFYFRTPVPVRTAKVGALDIKGQNSYVLYPPSIHHGGTAYKVVDDGPIYVLKDLDELGFVELEKYSESTTTITDWLSQIPDVFVPRKAQLLLEGDRTALGRYKSRSEAEMAICCSLYRIGFTYHDALRLFSTHEHPGKFRQKLEKNQRSATKYLEHTWAAAVRFVEEQVTEVELTARGMREWAWNTPWPGRSGCYDRVAFIAHTVIMENVGQLEHYVDVRTLGLMCGVSQTAAGNASKRLKAKELFKVTPSDDAFEAFTFVPILKREMMEYIDETLKPLHKSNEISDTRTVITCKGLNYTASRDAFRYKALGKSAAQMWDIYLERGSMSEREMAEASGRSLSTVRRANWSMAEVGLLEQFADGRWKPCLDASLDEAAELHHTTGKLRRQAEEDELQRRRFGERTYTEEELGGPLPTFKRQKQDDF